MRCRRLLTGALAVLLAGALWWGAWQTMLPQPDVPEPQPLWILTDDGGRLVQYEYGQLEQPVRIWSVYTALLPGTAVSAAPIPPPVQLSAAAIRHPLARNASIRSRAVFPSFIVPSKVISFCKNSIIPRGFCQGIPLAWGDGMGYNRGRWKCLEKKEDKL